MDNLTSNYYVYVYIDPRNFEEFYYGKGTGNRKYSHRKDIKDAEDIPEKMIQASDEPDKVKRIKAILKEGLEPIIKVIAKDLTEEQAFLVEKTLIWRLYRGLTNISPGNFAENFRPHDTFHKDLMGFDFENDAYYVNVGDGDHRSWEDCRDYGFLSAGQHPKWSKPIRSLKRGDVVVAYLKNRGYVGIGKVSGEAVKPSQFRYDSKPLPRQDLKQPDIFVNDDNENSEYLVAIDWVKSVDRGDAKWKSKSKLFTTQLVKASLQKQPETQRFLQDQFEVSFEELLSEGESPTT